MYGALIVSVGMTREPVIHALRQHGPDFVCFFASQESVDFLGEIKARAGRPFEDEKVLVDDPEDLVRCYEKALECFGRVERAGFANEAIVVDYTGGTKVMVAALAMAGAARGVRFSYVGGERERGNAGRVVAGAERIKLGVDPWEIFAVEEKRRIAQYFNAHQYQAASLSLRALLPRLEPRERALLEALLEIVEGYAAWDHFEHAEALRRLGEGGRLLGARAAAARCTEYDGFLDAVADNVAILQAMARQTKGFARAHETLVVDLVASGDRRLDEGRFDDAVARFYRALELSGQIAFERLLGVSASEVPVDRVPVRLRDEYAARYRSQTDGMLVLPLEATYRVLAELGDPAGKRFTAAEKEIGRIQAVRDRSILAHGLCPVGAEEALGLRGVVTAFVPAGLPVPKFPMLPWDRAAKRRRRGCRRRQ